MLSVSVGLDIPRLPDLDDTVVAEGYVDVLINNTAALEHLPQPQGHKIESRMIGPKS